MADHDDFEARRLALQTKLDGERTQAERNRLGQFATPTALAREIVAHSLTLLRSGEPIRFLDPAIGTGSFYSALRATAAPEQVAAAAGHEIDAHYAGPARELWVSTPLRLTLGDFTAAPLPEPGARANLVVCNPPYVRHHHMSREEKARLQDASQVACGVRVAGLAGLYTYFLALSHAWMADDGVAAWLMPSEFMDVNYGKAVKQYLLKQVTLLRIHRFDPADVQFGDALVSSAVVWFRRAPPLRRHEVQFTFGGPLAAPNVRRLVSTADLAHEAKWTRYPVFGVREAHVGPKLKDFFKIQRGIATGDNKFFIMTAGEAEARGVPRKFLTPILPSPRYMPEDEIAADAEGVPLIGRRLFLLDCRLPEAGVRAKHPDLWAYLQQGVPNVSDRYLCAHRSPWYSQEDRPAAPIVCTYMGRSDGKNGAAPFRFILNHSNATAANVYLLLYPTHRLRRALDIQPGLLRRVWELLRAIRPDDLLDEGRVYGGGLHKMEPKELANVPAEQIGAIVSAVDGGALATPRDLFGVVAAE